MRGVNRYEELLRGDHALDTDRVEVLLEKNANFTGFHRPCIFLSHKSEDKPVVLRIADYIMGAGIDIYLDANDTNLQKAVRIGDHVKITKFIEIGIMESTHLMSIVSEKTKESWWVSFEIGYAKSKGKNLSTLKLKGVSYLPSFLKITDILTSTARLNHYLQSFKRVLLESQSYNKLATSRLTGVTEGIIPANQPKHPLDRYLERR